MRQYKKMQKTAGWSLVELLLSLAIIGVLTSVVLASTGASRVGARDSTRVSDLKQIQLALAVYYDVNRNYPANGDLSVLVTDKYMPSLPVDPKSASAYEYARISSNAYCLGAVLENTNTLPNDNSSCSTGGSANYKVEQPIN